LESKRLRLYLSHFIKTALNAVQEHIRIKKVRLVAKHVLVEDTNLVKVNRRVLHVHGDIIVVHKVQNATNVRLESMQIQLVCPHVRVVEQ
jgi:hypothetical protein